MTQETAREWFSYDPETGILTWKKRGSGVTVGREAGWVQRMVGGKMYRRVMIRGCPTYAHRIIWVFVTGYRPVKPEEIDHADGDGLNNRWKNLRLVANRLEQSKNRRLYMRNTSGVVGVGFRPDRGKYEASIRVDGRLHFLGRFSRLKDAVAARQAASKKYGFHENHGQVRPL